jgi:hypothetical protein
MARSNYYEKRSKSVDKYFELKELIKDIYHKTKVVTVIEELQMNQQGVVINHKTILRLMKSRLKKCYLKKYKS